MTSGEGVSEASEQWLTRKYDVFISYRRTDVELCDKFFRAIQRLGLEPFVDEKCVPAGIPWEKAIESILKPPSDAVLLVLGTDSVFRDPKWVKREVDFAKARPGGTEILLVQYAEGVSDKLGLGGIQYRRARIGDQDLLVDDLVELLSDDLHERLRRRFAGPRIDAELWAADILDPLQPDFWGSEWRRHFSSQSSIALLADGGSGKTVCLAHYLRHVLKEDRLSKCHVLLISDSVLKDGPEGVAEIVGARAGKGAEHASRLKEEWDESFLFVVDSLDRVRFESQRILQQIKETLQALAECGRVVVTCRRQVWDNDYQDLYFNVVFLPPLQLHVVEKFLPGVTIEPPQGSILEIPLFLDHAIRIVRRGAALPENISDFLWDIYDEPKTLVGGRSIPTEEAAQIASFLRALASQQMEEMTFEVSLESIAERIRFSPEEIETVLTGLRNTRMLHEIHGRIRLRHDLIDGHGMVRLLLEAETGKSTRKSFWQRLHGDCGWKVASSLLLVAFDKQLEDLTRETFEEFAYILDHKRFSAEFMSKAWAVTYALRERIYEVWPIIKEYLDGDLAESLDLRNPADLDRKGSRPSCATQETASTLASAFLGLSLERQIEDRDLVRVLVHWLNRPGYGYLKRFIQALTNLGTREAKEAFFVFTRRELESQDVERFDVLAISLGQFRDPEAVNLLKRIYEHPAASARTRRLALESLRNVDRFHEWPMPKIEDDEMIQGLAVHNERGSYSDWQTVSEYAGRAKAVLRDGGHLSQPVVDALLKAMKHDQTYVKKPVAECLGRLDAPAARNALLSELLSRSLPAEVRIPCIESLKMQLLRQPNTQSRLAFRLILLAASHAARQSQALLAVRDLLHLATDAELFHRNDWLVTPTAVQVVPPLTSGESWEVREEFVPPEQYPVPISAEEFLTEEERVQIGAPLETKFRLAGAVINERKIVLRLAETDWVTSRSFHALASKNLTRVTEILNRWPEPVPVGTDWLPGILAVHCVVTTSDGHLLLARRSERAAYYPGHWSVSFEEQICGADFIKNDSASAAGRRGFAEEFGAGLRIRQLVTLSALIEVETLNFALVVLLETDETADSVIKSWQTEPRPSHYHEASEVRFEPISRHADSSNALSGLPLHPTSELRLAFWRDWNRRQRRT